MGSDACSKVQVLRAHQIFVDALKRGRSAAHSVLPPSSTLGLVHPNSTCQEWRQIKKWPSLGIASCHSLVFEGAEAHAGCFVCSCLMVSAQWHELPALIDWSWRVGA